jgi:hypothetical protein
MFYVEFFSQLSEEMAEKLNENCLELSKYQEKGIF